MLAPVVVHVAYAGSGADRTVYHALSPNPGGAPDHDSADDSETQSWDLRYPRAITLPACGSGSCDGAAKLTGASGRTRLLGTVDHVHRDGLYAYDDTSAHCTLTYAPATDPEPGAIVTVRYTRDTVAFQALDPIVTAEILMPTECPSAGDSLDGLANNYFTPGYSLLPGYGPARWFTSAVVKVSRRTLTVGRRLRLRMGLTAAGRSPRNCDRGGPSYATCSTSGEWSGVLTVTLSRAKT